MRCASIASDLVDLARGVPLDAARAGAIERHARECAACAARLDRQRGLSAEMRRLAEDTPPPHLDRARESALLAAFDAAWVRPPSSRRRRLAAGGFFGAIAAVIAWAVVRAPAPTVAPHDARRLPTVAVGGGGPAAVPPSASASIGEPPAIGVTHARGRESARRRHTAAPPPANAVDPARFIVWPGADDLPTFESGHLVRMQLPAAIVESIGLTPAPNSAVVEADVLVDQGGFARAVRLVP